MRDKCEGQVGDKCKLMRPKAPRVGDKCERQVEDKCKLMRPKAPKCEGQVWETSVKSFGPRHPEWETSVGDKRETSVTHAAEGTLSGRQVWEANGRQVYTHAARGTQSGRQVWETSGRQV